MGNYTFCTSKHIDPKTGLEWQCTSIMNFGHLNKMHCTLWKQGKDGKLYPTLNWPITIVDREMIAIIHKELTR